jgi:arsenate reductase (glutaredoxin)
VTAATAAFDEAGIDYVVRRYLDDPPTATELGDVVRRLGLEPWDVARPKETKQAGFADLLRDDAHRGEWLAAMAANPITIQRPIITADDGETVIARDDETLKKLLS